MAWGDWTDFGGGQQFNYPPEIGESQLGSLTAAQKGVLYRGLIGSTEVPEPTPTLGQRFMTGLQQASPLLAKVGGTLMGGKNWPAGQAGLLIGQGLESMQINKALRKMLAEYLGGRPTTTTMGPTDSPALGISDLTALGLTPEAVTGLYDKAVGITEKIRKEPFSILTMAADIYNKVSAGDYSQAQVPYLRAQAEKALAEVQNMPVKNFYEMVKLQNLTTQLQATLTRLQSDLETAKTTREKNVAQTEESREKARKSRWESSPEGMRAKAWFDALEKRAGTSLAFEKTGDYLRALNPFTGEEVGKYPIAATPGAGVKGYSYTNAKDMASSYFLDIARETIFKNNPVQEKAMRQFENLRNTLKDPVTGMINDTKLKNALSPEDRDLYNQATDIAKRAFSNEIPIAVAGRQIEGLIAGRGAVKPPAPGTPAPPKTGGPATPPPPREGMVLDPAKVIAAIRNKEIYTNPETGGTSIPATVEYIKKMAKDAGITMSDAQALKFLKEKVVPLAGGGGA